MNLSELRFFAGRSTLELGRKIAKSYGCTLGNVTFQDFSDGEMQVSYEETLRGKTVFLMQSTCQPIDNLFELLLMVDAAKRASAKKIIAVIPYFGYARQDRKDKPRVAIGSKLVANILQVSGIHRLITMDLHADQIQGFFEIPVDHLYASTLFLPLIKDEIIKKNTNDFVIAAPDVGAGKRASVYAKHLGCDLVICHKQRKEANAVESINVIGNVKDKTVIMVDDMVDTAGTLIQSSNMFLEFGAKEVYAFIGHGVLSGKAHERIANSNIKKIFVTDTITLTTPNPKIHVVSVDNLFASVITNIMQDSSISTHFLAST